MHNLAKTILGDIPYVIAGGYPRDLYFKVTPKDCDVFVNAEYRNEVIKAVRDNIIAFEEYTSYGDTENSKHITSVIKLLAGNLDIILVQDYIPLVDITKFFDFNLNQWRLIANNPVYEGDSPFHKLVMIQDDLTPVRVSKMITKHKELIKNGKV